MSDGISREAALAAFTGYMTRRHLRKTPERYAVFDKAMDIKGHFLVETLHALMAESDYPVSRATVYNTLDLLVDCGLLRRHAFGATRAPQYEAVGMGISHHHLVCTMCGKVREIDNPEVTRQIQRAVRRMADPSFTPSYFELQIHGICSTCMRKKKKEVKAAKG